MGSHENALLGAIEAGGTKLVCAVGYGPPDALLARVELPTGDDPGRALGAAARWLSDRAAEHGALRALGIASFGPIDLDPRSPTYGFITKTPKPGWQYADIVTPIRQAFPGTPVGLDTDVNGAALGESLWGNARGLEDFIYITIGTGIGGGGMARGRLLHGLVHPEMGHISLPRIDGDDFEGACPYHGRCWEGLCSGPAIAKRAGAPAEALPADHPAWVLAAGYTALAVANLICVLSPRKVILGGSVRKGGKLGEAAFFARVRERVREALNAYIRADALEGDAIADYIVPPLLGDDAGVCGAMALAQCAIEPASTIPG